MEIKSSFLKRIYAGIFTNPKDTYAKKKVTVRNDLFLKTSDKGEGSSGVQDETHLVVGCRWEGKVAREMRGKSQTPKYIQVNSYR